MNIYESISAVMSDVGVIGKNTRNTQQNFMFRGIDAVMNALQPAMLKNHIFVVPEVLEQTREERLSQKGATLIYSILKVKYTFYAEDGSSISAVIIGEGMDSGDKASNKAMSIAFKYACFQVFCIPTEEMKDPDAECHEVKPAAAAKTYQQEKRETIEKANISEAEAKRITDQCEKDGINPAFICGKLNVNDIEDLTKKQYVWLLTNWSKEIVNGVQGTN